jgi:hypothetical protein
VAVCSWQQQRVIASNPEQSNLMLALNNPALYFGASVGTAIEGAVISAATLNAGPAVSAVLTGLALILLVALPQPSIPQAALNASAAGMREARSAGNRPPNSATTVDQASPKATRLPVTRSLNIPQM